jgi:hypothetical protein
MLERSDAPKNTKAWYSRHDPPKTRCSAKGVAWALTAQTAPRRATSAQASIIYFPRTSTTLSISARLTELRRRFTSADDAIIWAATSSPIRTVQSAPKRPVSARLSRALRPVGSPGYSRAGRRLGRMFMHPPALARTPAIAAVGSSWHHLLPGWLPGRRLAGCCVAHGVLAGVAVAICAL